MLDGVREALEIAGQPALEGDAQAVGVRPAIGLRNDLGFVERTWQLISTNVTCDRRGDQQALTSTQLRMHCKCLC